MLLSDDTSYTVSMFAISYRHQTTTAVCVCSSYLGLPNAEFWKMWLQTVLICLMMSVRYTSTQFFSSAATPCGCTKEIAGMEEEMRNETEQLLKTLQSRFEKQSKQMELLETQNKQQDGLLKKLQQLVDTQVYEQSLEMELLAMLMTEQKSFEKQSKEQQKQNKQQEDLLKKLSTEVEQLDANTKHEENRSVAQDEQIVKLKSKVEEMKKLQTKMGTVVWLEQSIMKDMRDIKDKFVWKMGEKSFQKDEFVMRTSRSLVQLNRYDLLQKLMQEVITEVYQYTSLKALITSMEHTVPELEIAGYRAILNNMKRNGDVDRVEVLQLADNLKKMSKLSGAALVDWRGLTDSLPYSVRNIVFAKVVCIVSAPVNITWRTKWELTRRDNGNYLLKDHDVKKYWRTENKEWFEDTIGEVTAKNEFEFLPRQDNVIIHIVHNDEYLGLGPTERKDRDRYRIDDCSK